MGIEIDCILDSRSVVGEGIVWDVETQRLWWVDIPPGLVHCTDPATGLTQTRGMGEPVGCLALRAGGGLVLATKSGFKLLDWESGAVTPITDPEAHLPHNRFNDGNTDPAGRFWAGSMRDPRDLTQPPTGTFYRLDPDHSVTPGPTELYTANGLAFSPDGSRMYYSDSAPNVRTIWVCDYDLETGTPGAPRVLFDTRAVTGRPDGGTVDADGCYWMAGVSGWQLYRITPEGKLDRTIDLPIEKPSRPMFGGPNLDVLYLTSIGGEDIAEPKRQPRAGGLFALTGLGVQGVPQARFKG
ncbi:SMP-30/gluconolactonase/LRE family protein [Maliponia aquimaris]|uniref:Regucalcin n=1 Tax=Maliponia aquimaris TaxID=1673631 RepID=A0A238KR84_9RHOB|nr:SMP-30/gluconolactonase/LRE family protein [Maliponia aquimaris]SMX45170.1 L-arabinolactonase [Maliponia aquimaris]